LTVAIEWSAADLKAERDDKWVVPKEIADQSELIEKLRAELAAAREIGKKWYADIQRLESELAAMKGFRDECERQFQEKVAELAAERDKRRWNIEEDGNALLICKGHHEKYEGCTFVSYVPEAELAAEREAHEANKRDYLNVKSWWNNERVRKQSAKIFLDGAEAARHAARGAGANAASDNVGQGRAPRHRRRAEGDGT
jgi:DNA repair exonuclease SbcCD ATPase subunit